MELVYDIISIIFHRSMDLLISSILMYQYNINADNLQDSNVKLRISFQK